MASVSNHIYCPLHGFKVARSGDYPYIAADFDITFTRADGSDVVYWQVSNNEWAGTDSGEGKFGYNFDAWLSVNVANPTSNDLWHLIEKDYDTGLYWWNQVSNYNPPGPSAVEDAKFTTTSSTATVYLWVTERECMDDGHFCYDDEDHGTYYFIDSFTVNLPTYATSYTVSYNANGGEDAPASQTKWNTDAYILISNHQPIYPITIVHHNDPDISSITNRPFLYWTTNSDGTGTRYDPLDQYSANASCTLYAKWDSVSFTPIAMEDKYYIVTYNANGGKGVPASVNLSLAKNGYATSSGGSAVYQPGTSYTIAEGIHRIDLYPIYGNATLSSLPTPMKEGSQFLGWYDNPQFNGSPITTPYTVTGNITLYAKWKSLPIHIMGRNGEWQDIGPYVWRFNGTSWEKIAHIYRFNGTSWEDISR